VVVAIRYESYYLNVMAGPKREWHFKKRSGARMDAEALKRGAGAARTGAATATRPTPVVCAARPIGTEYDALPRQLKSVAKYVEQHRARVNGRPYRDIAVHCGVQPSAVVRFAQRFGYPGFSAMQAVFRHDYTEQASPLASYQQRSGPSSPPSAIR